MKKHIIKAFALLLAVTAALSACSSRTVYVSYDEVVSKPNDAPAIVSEDSAADEGVSENIIHYEGPSEESADGEREAYFSVLDHALMELGSEDEQKVFSDYLLAGMAHHTVELVSDGGKTVYYVSMETPDFLYSYAIDPKTFEVLEYDREPNDDFDPVEFGIIVPFTTTADALQGALDFFGFSKDEITDASVELDNEKMQYDVRFTYDGVEYVCEVDTWAEFLRSNVDVGPYGATDIALAHMLDSAESEEVCQELVNFALAGSMSDIEKETLGGNDDRQYRVGFSIGGYAYDYLIDGHTGEIIEHKRDFDSNWNGPVVSNVN